MSEPTQRMIETNGIRLNIAEQGNGPLVLLCHGFPESWYSWRHQIDALAAAGFHAVAPDMRGYGKSDRPEAIDQYPNRRHRRPRLGRRHRLAGGAPAPRPLPRHRSPQRTVPAAQPGAPDHRDAADRGRPILP